MNEYQIRGVILFIESAIDDIPVFRAKPEFMAGYQRLKRSFARIGYEKLCLVTWHIVTSGNGFDQRAVIAPGAGIIVFIPNMVNLGCCNEESIHQGPCKVYDRVGACPNIQVFTFVETSTGTCQIISLGLFVGIDVGIAHGNIIKRNRLDFWLRTWLPNCWYLSTRPESRAGSAEIILSRIGWWCLCPSKNLLFFFCLSLRCDLFWIA